MTPENAGGGDTHPSSVNPVRVKRVSTSIPTLSSSTRRQSAPVHGLVSNLRSTSLVGSPVISTPPRAVPAPQRDPVTLKAPPSVAGSARTARSSLFGVTNSPPQIAAPVAPSTPRSRVQSLGTLLERSHVKESPDTSLSVSSPSINLTTPSPQSNKSKSSPRPSPRAIHAESPSRKSSVPSQANGKSRNRQNGSVRSTVSMSTPPWRPDLRQVNGDEDLAMSIWDGDDITLDMVTEAEDENVDEEVSILNDVSST